MSTTEPAAIETTADDLADAVEHVAQARHDAAVAELRAAQRSPLDASLARGNPRQRHGDQTVWNVFDVMVTPSMAFDPAQITSLEHYEELQGYGVSLAEGALKDLHSTVARLIEARQTLRANEVSHPSAQALELDDLHTKLMPVVTGKIDAAVATISKAIAAHEATLSAQVKDNASGAEIRGYVRSLSLGERRKVLQEAINSGDAVVVGALLGASTRVLAGLQLTDEMHTAYLRQWHERRDAETAKKLALARAAVQKLEAAGSLFVASTERIVGVNEKTIQKLRAQRAQVRKALGGA